MSMRFSYLIDLSINRAKKTTNQVVQEECLRGELGHLRADSIQDPENTGSACRRDEPLLV